MRAVLRRFRNVAVGLVASLCVGALSAVGAPSASAATGEVLSLNYAGFVAVNGTYDHILATIEVPDSNCGGLSLNSESASGYWVGLGGVNGKALEQTGITTHCKNGVPVYAAFYEILPGDGPHLLPPLPYTVFPGDYVDVEITHEGSNFTFRIKDGMWSYEETRSQSTMDDALSSADFVSEAPGDKTQPLTNFGSVHFQNCWANHTLLTDLSDNVQRWTMVDKNKNTKAHPSDLTPYGGHGPAFDVKWVSAGP
jgi:hypothetical protein